MSRSRVRVSVVVLFVLLAGLTRAIASANPVDDEVRAELLRLVAFAWQAPEPLLWGDFQGSAPSGGVEGARTVYSLVYGVQCDRRTFHFGVVAAFLPKSSWVLPSVLADAGLGQRTLDHEQTHFNLTEIYARRMRKYFAEMYEPCLQSEDDLRSSAEKFVSAEHDEQTRYDQETGHGLVRARQSAWDSDVSDRLASLKAFAR